MRVSKGMLTRAALALAFCALAGATAFAAGPAEWTQFRLNDTNNVVIPGTLSTSWKVVEGGPISASPTVDGTTLFLGDNRGNLIAIDVTSGHVLWKYHSRNDLMAAPLIYRGLIIVGQGDEISHGSAPGTVYVGLGPSAIVAFDEANGAIRWRTAVAGSAMPTPAIIDGLLVDHNGAGWLTALNPMTGAVVYAKNLHSIASMTAATPVGGDRFVTLGVLNNAAFEIDAKNGNIIWQTPFNEIGSGLGDCPPVFDGTRIMCDYMMPKPPATYTIEGTPAILHAYAIDAKTGKVLWDVTVGTGILPPRNEASIPLYSNGVLYLGSAISPYFHALDAKTGRLLWKCKVHGPVKGGSVLVDGVSYFGDLRGYLWAVNAKTGAVIGDEKMPSGFNVGSPIVYGKTLIIGSRTGSIYALPLSDIRMHHDA